MCSASFSSETRFIDLYWLAHWECLSLPSGFIVGSIKIMDLSVEYNVPIGFGVLTCYNLEQAIIRSDINQKNKGQEAALACIELLK